MLTPLVSVYLLPISIGWVFIYATLFPALRALRLWKPKELQFTKADMRDKIVIVTGCNTGIGRATAVNIAKLGATVVMACRDPERAKAAKEEMEVELKEAAATPDKYPFAQKGRFLTMSLDLSSLAAVKTFAKEFRDTYSRLDALVLNAGLAKVKARSKDGYDLIMATNYLGHFYLAKLLLDVVKKTENARIVSVSSVMHEFGGTDFEGALTRQYTKTWQTRAFSAPYQDSKLAMILLTLELNKRLKQTSARAIAVSPGAVFSDIWRNCGASFRKYFLDPVMTLLFLTNEQGCSTSVYAATHPLVEEDKEEEEDDAPYYMPYWSPGRHFLLPFEAFGPWNGWTKVNPRLPDQPERAARELWYISEKCLMNHHFQEGTIEETKF